MKHKRTGVQLKKVIAIAVTAVLLAASQIILLPAGLSREGLTAILMFISAIVLWIGESWMMGVSGLLLLFLCPWFNVMPISECYANFGGTAFTFVLATFALTATMCTTTLPQRISKKAVMIGSTNSGRLVLVMMLACGILSAIMSNLAATAMFITLARPLIKSHMRAGGGTCNLAKCLYIGIPVAANFGGFMTIAGSPSNIVVVNLIEQYTAVRVTFLDYMLVGVPVGLIAIILSWLVLTGTYKPEPLSRETVEAYLGGKEVGVPLTARERKGIGIIAATFICWILSTWIPVLDTTVVAILCMALLMAPGVHVLSWEQFNEHTNWDVVLLVGVIPALVAGMMKHGAGEWMVVNLFGGLMGLSPIMVCLACALLFAVLRNVVPTGIAFISLMTIPVLGIVDSTGANMVGLMLILTFWSLVILILPFDPIYMLGYGDGYFSAKDTAKSGAVMTVLLVIISALLIPLITQWLGY